MTDGLSKTFLFFECAGRPIHFFKGVDVTYAGTTPDPVTNHRWADPATYGTWGPGEDCGLSTVMNCENFDEIYSFHPGGAIFLYGDGSADLLSENVDVDTFISLFTRAGDDIAGAKN